MPSNRASVASSSLAPWSRVDCRQTRSPCRTKPPNSNCSPSRGIGAAASNGRRDARSRDARERRVPEPVVELPILPPRSVNDTPIAADAQLSLDCLLECAGCTACPVIAIVLRALSCVPFSTPRPADIDRDPAGRICITFTSRLALPLRPTLRVSAPLLGHVVSVTIAPPPLNRLVAVLADAPLRRLDSVSLLVRRDRRPRTPAPGPRAGSPLGVDDAAPAAAANGALCSSSVHSVHDRAPSLGSTSALATAPGLCGGPARCRCAYLRRQTAPRGERVMPMYRGRAAHGPPPRRCRPARVAFLRRQTPPRLAKRILEPSVRCTAAPPHDHGATTALLPRCWLRLLHLRDVRLPPRAPAGPPITRIQSIRAPLVVRDLPRSPVDHSRPFRGIVRLIVRPASSASAAHLRGRLVGAGRLVGVGESSAAASPRPRARIGLLPLGARANRWNS